MPLQSHTEDAYGQRASDDTERDELRGVIDDLTVENKRLKHILNHRQLRRSPSVDGPDRIIEVRMHGLPAEKKRELEQLLKTFATGLNGDTSPGRSGPSAPVAMSLPSPGMSVPPGLKQELTTNTDSGYASVSGSGLNSSTGAVKLHEPVSKSKRDKDIKDYLHDIPDFLFPQDTLSLSESAKMTMVVQRLEQLFTGNLAGPGEHSLPLQQQQISRAAAKADRAEDRRQNRAMKMEGSREARVLPADSKINFDSVEHDQAPSQRQDHNEGETSSGTPRSTLERPDSPNQRPTRPLDLDIHRAQVAVDNVMYLRHLGFSSPPFGENPEGKQRPWMYLNLLISMAQLHTLNVTPAFVRKAIKQLSSKFELSKDGHKIRWRGGPAENATPEVDVRSDSAGQRASEGTPDESGRRSGQGSVTSTLNDPPSMSLSDPQHMHDKPSTTTSKLVTQSTTTSSLAALNASSTRSKSSAFNYKPIIFKGRRLRHKANNSYLDSSSSYDESSGEPSGLAHAMSRSSLRTKEGGHEGLMTFFSNPYFCTDLSGDRSPINMTSVDVEDERKVLGIARQELSQEEVLRDASACYYTARVDDIMRSWPAICPDIKMEFPPIESAGEDETQPMELDASGIGGVRPEDNFALDVKVARVCIRDAGQGNTGKRKRGSRSAKYSYRTVSCTRLSLQPSRLPPPSYVFFTSSSSSSASNDHFYGDSNSESSSEDGSPPPAGLLWQWSSSSNELRFVDDNNSEASSSLGVLQAARARFFEPGAVAAQDRDYILGPSGRTMSGSLAATVGASWSVNSVAEPEPAREENDLSSDMSVDD